MEVLVGRTLWRVLSFSDEIRERSLTDWEDGRETEDKGEGRKDASQAWPSGGTRGMGLLGSTFVVMSLETAPRAPWFFPPPCSSAQVQGQSPWESDLARLGISQEWWTEGEWERQVRMCAWIMESKQSQKESEHKGKVCVLGAGVGPWKDTSYEDIKL